MNELAQPDNLTTNSIIILDGYPAYQRSPHPQVAHILRIFLPGLTHEKTLEAAP
jgi:hypothetical protein